MEQGRCWCSPPVSKTTAWRRVERDERLLEIVRGSGLRIVGPSSLGVINTAAEVSLNATFSGAHVQPGRAGDRRAGGRARDRAAWTCAGPADGDLDIGLGWRPC